MKQLLALILISTFFACGSGKESLNSQQNNQNVKITRTIPEDLNGMAKVSGNCFAINQSTNYRKELGGLVIEVLGADTSFTTDIKGQFSGELKPGKYQLKTTYNKETITSNIFSIKANTNTQFNMVFLLSFNP